MGRRKTHQVTLSQSEQNHLEHLISTGVEKARKLTRVRILLKTHLGWTDSQISDALDVGTATIESIRKRYAQEGLAAAINRRPSSRQYERKINGKDEAHLVALACSEAPEGHARWTLRLLADRLVTLEQVEVESVSHETVRRVQKKRT